MDGRSLGINIWDTLLAEALVNLLLTLKIFVINTVSSARVRELYPKPIPIISTFLEQPVHGQCAVYSVAGIIIITLSLIHI